MRDLPLEGKTPFSDFQLAEAEAAIGRKIPQDFKEFVSVTSRAMVVAARGGF